jgi:hypothetical protein
MRDGDEWNERVTFCGQLYERWNVVLVDDP